MSILKRGALIVIEGVDGSGKSTLVTNLAASLKKLTIPLVVTKEFGGTPLGQNLREIIHKKNVSIGDKAEYLLIAADRAQHSQALVLPSLQKGMLVLSDRMGDSSLVYQGYGRGLDKNMISMINQWAMNNKNPDLTIYVRIDLDIALQRILIRNITLTSFEKESREFFKRVVNGYDILYKDRQDVIIVDGTLAPKLLAQETLTKVITWLQTNHLLKKH